MNVLMRMIEVSTDVYAKLWAHRLAGEENEDAILRRLLNVAGGDVSMTDREVVSMKRTLWRDDVRTALDQLGGVAPLAQIYEKVRTLRCAAGRKIPPSHDAIVRRELEYNSSDSESFTGRFDWFRAAEGIGAGIWALR